MHTAPQTKTRRRLTPKASLTVFCSSGASVSTTRELCRISRMSCVTQELLSYGHFVQREAKLTSSAPGPTIFIWSSFSSSDWKMAEATATPSTCPIPRNSWTKPVPMASCDARGTRSISSNESERGGQLLRSIETSSAMKVVCSTTALPNPRGICGQEEM